MQIWCGSLAGERDILFTRLGLSAWRWVSPSTLSFAPGRHEMRDEQELSLPHCTHGERLEGASQLVGSEQAASGTGAPGLGRDCVPGLAVAQRHHPGTGTLGLGTAILEKERGALAACCNTCCLPGGMRGASRGGVPLVGKCWEGKYKFNRMLVISLCR